MRGERIEVENEGFPEVQPDDLRYQHLLHNWNNWAPLFRTAARRYGLPVSWVLAVATIETGLWSSKPAQQEKIVSPAGAVGIMQIMPQFQPETHEQLQDAATNINAGARILREQLDRSGGNLPYAVAAYNSGTNPLQNNGCRVGRNEWNFRADHNYPRQVIEYNHAAIRLGVNAPNPTTMMVWGGIIGATAAVFLRTINP